MRPVQRGDSPKSIDFYEYTDAKPFLASRLGQYCSYCERHVVTNLAVEHIQPKGICAYSHLQGRWNNFLLSCINCNSTKKDKNVALSNTLLPDRDNTFAAFDYHADGEIKISNQTPKDKIKLAECILSMVGLDKKISITLDENGKQVALDRVSQRIQTWGSALEAKNAVDNLPGNDALRRTVVLLAQSSGFFSIWMTVFSNDPDMRNRLIDAFPGTRGSGCFDPATTQSICPAPNPDQLTDGAKL